MLESSGSIGTEIGPTGLSILDNSRRIRWFRIISGSNPYAAQEIYLPEDTGTTADHDGGYTIAASESVLWALDGSTTWAAADIVVGFPNPHGLGFVGVKASGGAAGSLLTINSDATDSEPATTKITASLSTGLEFEEGTNGDGETTLQGIAAAYTQMGMVTTSNQILGQGVKKFPDGLYTTGTGVTPLVPAPAGWTLEIRERHFVNGDSTSGEGENLGWEFGIASPDSGGGVYNGAMSSWSYLTPYVFFGYQHGYAMGGPPQLLFQTLGTRGVGTFPAFTIFGAVNGSIGATRPQYAICEGGSGLAYLGGSSDNWQGALYRGGLFIGPVSPPPTSPPPTSPPVVPPSGLAPTPVPPAPKDPPPPVATGTDLVSGVYLAAPASPPPPMAIGGQAVEARTDLHFWKVFGRLIRFSPDGNAWEIKVDNAGTITASALSITPGEA